jgi:hypothetical protein
MEVMLKGAYLGATVRTIPAKEGKPERRYAELHSAVSMRQGPGAVGHEARTLRMEPSLFEKLRTVLIFAPVTLVCEESEYTREGGAVETVKLVVDVVPDQAPAKKAA